MGDADASHRLDDGDGVALASQGRRIPRLAPHAVALAAVLALMYVFVGHHGTAIADEGAYAAEAQALGNGSWSAARPVPDIDRDGHGEPLGSEVVDGVRRFPYPRHPTYSIAAWGAFELGGFGGLLALSVVGGWAAAVVSSLIVRRVDPTLDVPVLWLVGVGSPLIFSTFSVSAHALAAALAGLAFYALLRSVEERRAMWLVAAVASTVLLTNVRSEGTVYALALGLVVAASGVLRPRHPSRRRAIAGGAAVAAATLVGYRLDTWLTRRIVGDHFTASPTGQLPKERDPLGAAWKGLLQPWYGSGLQVNTALVLAGVCLVASAVAIRVAPKRPLAAIALLTLAVGASVGALFAAPMLVSGMLPTFPLLAAAVVLLRRDQLALSTVHLALATSLVTAVPLVVLLYEDAGSDQWGGRFFHLLIPILAPVIVVAVAGTLRSHPRPARAAVVAALSVVVLCLSVIPLRVNRENRRHSADLVTTTHDYVARHGAPGPRPLVVILQLNPDGMSRRFWRDDSSYDLLRYSIYDFLHALPRLERAGYRSVIAVTNRPKPFLEIYGREELPKVGWGFSDAVAIPGTAYAFFRVGPEWYDESDFVAEGATTPS